MQGKSPLKYRRDRDTSYLKRSPEVLPRKASDLELADADNALMNRLQDKADTKPSLKRILQQLKKSGKLGGGIDTPRLNSVEDNLHKLRQVVRNRKQQVHAIHQEDTEDPFVIKPGGDENVERRLKQVVSRKEGQPRGKGAGAYRLKLRPTADVKARVVHNPDASEDADRNVALQARPEDLIPFKSPASEYVPDSTPADKKKTGRITKISNTTKTKRDTRR